jgi:hypothetical protein
MKKNDSKKLRLSRETLQALTSAEAQNVAGGSRMSSCQSACAGPCPATGEPSTDPAAC